MLHLLLAIIYLAFINLGLPASVLGAAWPSMQQTLGVPVSYAGIVSMIIAVGTVVASLLSSRLSKRLNTGMATTISVAMTAAALFGFSLSRSFTMLCLCAIPYGLGAGILDVYLNNYVALHYASRHMSWLHCMWGVGASVGPYIMGYALTNGNGWNTGYRYIALLQLVMTAILIFSLPLWKEKKTAVSSDSKTVGKTLSLLEILRLPGAKAAMLTFFCYCALENTAGLWASSYLVLHNGIDADVAATYASLFYIGITVGRAVNGFLSIKLRDTQMIRLGQSIIIVGTVLLLLPFTQSIAPAGLILIGLGCAPINPCMLHSTPQHFGEDKSQAIIGVQMACAYMGTSLMPPIFGWISKYTSIATLPVFLLVILAVMIFAHEQLMCIMAKKAEIK